MAKKIKIVGQKIPHRKKEEFSRIHSAINSLLREDDIASQKVLEQLG